MATGTLPWTIESLLDKDSEDGEAHSAIQTASDHFDQDFIRDTILPYFEHDSPNVRKHAILSLCHHLNPSILDFLRWISVADPDPTVRAVSAETIQWARHMQAGEGEL